MNGTNDTNGTNGTNGTSSHIPKSPIMLVPLLCMFLLSTLFYFAPFHLLTNAQASGLVSLPGQVPALEKKSNLLGATDPATSVTLIVGLRLRNQASLQAYVKKLSRPHTTTTNSYLAPEQVAAAYGPLSESQNAVIAFMQQAGFSETMTFKQHLLIGFQGTLGQAEAAFNVQINTYKAPDGRQFYAPARNPQVPANLATIIQSISGLDNASHFTHPPVLTHKTSHAARSNAVNCPRPSSNGSYFLPSQLATAYNLNGLYNAGFRGEGQTVALFELDDYSQSNISTYTSCYGGAAVPISRILLNVGKKWGPSDGAIEVELDMELVLSAAPHLASLRVYEAPNSDSAALAEWGQIVNDAAPIVSTSWGQCETGITSPGYIAEENTLFTIAAAQGQSILAAAGDSGTNDCGNNSLSVDDPASQPYVTGVGGTTLTMNNNHYSSEVVWNNANQGYAGGGGISNIWTAPSWQQAPGVPDGVYSSASPCNAGVGKTCREVPDVSLNADPYTGYAMYCTIGSSCFGMHWFAIGGTSAAAPMWAAMTALANEKSLHDGNFNLGFLNPLLYQIANNASGTSYSSDFHDVTIGNNDSLGDQNTTYPATTGYDMASGLGSYNALSLANDLEKLAKNMNNSRSSSANTNWYFAEGNVGNSFHEFITMLNPSATQQATVTITYVFTSKPSVMVQHIVKTSTRSTIDVNGDLHVALNGPQQPVSAIVSSNIPIVAERPMYFNFHGVASGTDTLGATSAANTTFYFAESDARQTFNSKSITYVTILNPSQISTAHAVLTYYNHGNIVGTQNISVAPMHRSTITPSAIGLSVQAAIKVTSDSGIVVERTMYFRDIVPTAGGITTGATTVIGATSLGSINGSDWLFAEGYTGNGNTFQEYLVLANFTATAASANVKLEYTNGTAQTVPITVNAQSQYYFDVNHAYAHPIAGCNCTPTSTVSAEVTSSTPSIAAERLMYFHYGSKHISGGTDVMGEVGPSTHTVYTFAEGYTYGNFSEFLTLQNPNNSSEMVAVTLFAGSTITQETLQLKAYSRTTLNINSLVVPMANAYHNGPISNSFQVSMDIQALSGSIVAERPMYFTLNGNNGGTDVIGYTGG